MPLNVGKPFGSATYCHSLQLFIRNGYDQLLINIFFLDFSDSANDIRLEGTLLTAELPMRDGGYRERQGIELSERIANENGELVVSLPLLYALILSRANVDQHFVCLVCLGSTIKER